MKCFITVKQRVQEWFKYEGDRYIYLTTIKYKKLCPKCRKASEPQQLDVVKTVTLQTFYY